MCNRSSRHFENHTTYNGMLCKLNWTLWSKTPCLYHLWFWRSHIFKINPNGCHSGLLIYFFSMQKQHIMSMHIHQEEYLYNISSSLDHLKKPAIMMPWRPPCFRNWKQHQITQEIHMYLHTKRTCFQNPWFLPTAGMNSSSVYFVTHQVSNKKINLKCSKDPSGLSYDLLIDLWKRSKTRFSNVP